MNEGAAASLPSKGTLIDRPRLLARLAQARPLRCVVLRGPAGSGKTSLLLAWRRKLVADRADVAWLALSRADNEPSRFFDALLGALETIDPRLVADAAAILGRDSGEAAYEAVVIALLRAAGGFERDLVIVFDDAHHLTQPGMVKSLQMLLDFGPPHLQIVLATRGVLPLSLGRLRSQQQLLELGDEDLRFTWEESSELVRSVLGTIDDAQARGLYERSDGWAAGLKLLSLDRRRGRRRAAVRNPQAFAAYFEREVMGQLSAESVEFLLRSAIPEQFNVELSAALLAPLMDVAACERTLRELQERGLFVVPAGPRYPDGWWRLHPLLRNVLRERLRSLPAAEMQRLHTEAWNFFAARHMSYEAVQHARQAGADNEAGALVEERGTDLFVHGALRRLVALVRLLPPSVVEQRKGLRLWLAWAELYEQRLVDCAGSIARLQVDLADAPPAQRYRLTLLRVLHAVQCDDSAAAMAVLPELLDAPPDADAVALTGRRTMLTWIHLYRRDYDGARRVQLDDEVPVFDGHPVYGTAIGLLGGRCLLGLTYAVEGQMLQAERIYRDVLFEAERRGSSCADPGTLAAALLAEVLYELNDSEGVLALLEPRTDVIERVSFPDTRLRTGLYMARAHWALGHPLDAIESLEYAIDSAQGKGLDRVQAHMLLELLRIRLRRGEFTQGQELLERLDAIDQRHAGAKHGTLAEIYVVAERGRIYMWLHMGDFERALAHIGELESVCVQRGRARRVPDLKLQGAVALKALGHPVEADEQVREALRLGQPLGLLRTLLDAHHEVPTLIREALSDEGLDPVLRFYAERLNAAHRSPTPAAAALARPAPPGRELLSPRESEIVDLLKQNLSNKRIARALDLSIDTVKWHLKNIYGKLAVSGRDEVLARLDG